MNPKNFVSIKKKYYEWRFWNNVYREMLKHIKIFGDKSNQQLTPYINKPGIALSFDDSYRIKDWTKYGKDIFGYYDVKVTFNINAIHHFEGKREHSQNEIDLLLDLQGHGHEIAHHSLTHKKATEYSNQFGINKWIEDEIISLFQWMGKQTHSKTGEGFKKPVTFAFPHFLYNSENIQKLIPKYFKIARGYHDKDNLTAFNHQGFAPSICLDGYYSCNLKYVEKMIKKAKEASKNLIITCHSILPKEVDWDDFGWGEESNKSGTWRTTPETIQFIIDVAKKFNMEFYTTAELAGIATFIDENFEMAVREQITNPKAKWIPISELIEITELDLSNRNIANLDGIQYFLNLESLNLANNQIKNFRLLEKLPKLSNLNIENNSIQTNKKIV
ncbi:polysaccharide deacetylase family protein [Neobacillus massiliamazoniensis]|uniref:polysaccharide deacetylase family protein n=1 Tax=Neobacillus massiliamazoniensis TaxID=1499688 RepID=UPI001FE0C1D6|nr:polysaccharide deacetylase family protein [Neobacillus massiliamazoniensis]